MTRSLLSALGLCAALLLTGCPASDGGAAASPDGLDQARARGKLVVCMEVGYDPFEVMAEDGKFTGYDVDLVQAVAKDLGLEVELRNVAFDGILNDLLTGQCDAVFSGMSITADRQQAVDFSRPYFSVGQVILKRKGDARIQKPADLDREGITVATQQGTTGEQAVQRTMPKARILRFPKADEACMAVVGGQADAVVFDHPFLIKFLARQGEALEGLLEPFTEEPIGAAVRKDSPKLREAIDRTLARLEQSGELAKLREKWFPAPPAAAAGGASGQ